MSIARRVGFSIGAAVLGVGTLVGVAACSSTTSSGDASSSQAPGNGQGGEGRRSEEISGLAAALAKGLGIDESKVTTALNDYMTSLRPSGAGRPTGGSMPSGQPTGGSMPSGEPNGGGGMPSGQPTGGSMPNGQGGGQGRGGLRMLTDSASREKLATYLAEKLSVDKAKVTTIIEEYVASQKTASASASPTS